MILASKNHVYFTESTDSLEVQGNSVVLVRNVGSRVAYLNLGTYVSSERAQEVLADAVKNLDAGGLIFPEV